MQEKLTAARAAVAARRWRWRAVLWATFALVSLAFPQAAESEQGYLFALIGLAMLTGALDPRPFINTTMGVFFAVLVQIALQPAGAEIHTAVEIVTIPLFAGPARVAVWALLERGRPPATTLAAVEAA